MDDDEIDAAVRQAAFNLLSRLSWQYGDSLPRRVLENGFDFNGNRVHLCGPQGIFKPKMLALPLSITTAPNQPYNDALTSDGRLAYKYRGQDPQHRDNVGLRQIMVEKKPLIYLHGLVQGWYLAAWPVFVVEDNPQTLTFTVDLDTVAPDVVAPDTVALDTVALDLDASGEPTPTYGLTMIQRRLHQGYFRARVLKAYRERCALCKLQHISLLDAAHIIPDSVGGKPSTTNGLSLCKLHHAAFDQNILGIRPDNIVEIRLDILEEIDGPMLKHGLQEMHGREILIPRRVNDRPDKDALEQRYAQFRATH